MELAAVDGVELEYELHGTGEPVVLIHWGVSARWAEPLLAEADLAERYRLLWYHRAGFAGSSRLAGAISMGDHARHCRLLMRQLGIERAHVVGHSSSALVALQLALDAKDAVQSLALMDAARPAPATELQAAFLRDVAAVAIGQYRAGDIAGAVDTWARGVFGPDYRDRLDRGIPGLFEEILTSAETFFAQELPAVRQWSFTESDARRIAPPVLALVGQNSVSTFHERRDLLLGWLPQVEAFDLPGATHLCHIERPHEVAGALASFFARHPFEASS
jgi:pimeloyl-ACP methyl ester carboxylesterase